MPGGYVSLGVLTEQEQTYINSVAEHQIRVYVTLTCDKKGIKDEAVRDDLADAMRRWINAGGRTEGDPNSLSRILIRASWAVFVDDLLSLNNDPLNPVTPQEIDVDRVKASLEEIALYEIHKNAPTEVLDDEEKVRRTNDLMDKLRDKMVAQVRALDLRLEESQKVGSVATAISSIASSSADDQHQQLIDLILATAGRAPPPPTVTPPTGIAPAFPAGSPAILLRPPTVTRQRWV